MVKQMTLKQLQKAIEKEKAKASSTEERRNLEAQLKALREGPSKKLIRRFGRGFVVLTKKGAKATGEGIKKARKFAEETGAGEGLDVDLSRRIKYPKRLVVTRRTKTTIRRVRSKPKKRSRTVQSGTRSPGGFFGGLGLTDI